MAEKIISDEDVIRTFIPKKAAQDNLLVTASFGMIIGLIFLVGNDQQFSSAVKFSLVSSICSLAISLFSLLWFNPRLEFRSKLMKRVVEQRIEKIREDIKKFANYYYTPLFKAKLVNNLQELRTKKFGSPDDFRQALNLATSKAEKDSEPSKENNEFATRMFYNDFLKDMYFLDQKIFHTPIDESYGKWKHLLDIFSFRFRYHFFVIGVVSLVFAVVIRLLS